VNPVPKLEEEEEEECEEYSIQHYVINVVSDLQQVGGFLWVLWFPPTPTV
jgi:hypothetical protein